MSDYLHDYFQAKLTRHSRALEAAKTNNGQVLLIDASDHHHQKHNLTRRASQALNGEHAQTVTPREWYISAGLVLQPSLRG